MEGRFAGLKNRDRMQVERLRKRLIRELRKRGAFEKEERKRSRSEKSAGK